MNYEEWKETYYDHLVDDFKKLKHITHFESFCQSVWRERQMNSEDMDCEY